MQEGLTPPVDRAATVRRGVGLRPCGMIATRLKPIVHAGPATLRPWAATDVEALVRYANNRKIWANVRDRFPHPYTPADAEQWTAYASKKVPLTDLAIEVEGEAAGGIGIILRDDVERCGAEIGYWLGEPFWGRGIATASVRAMTEYAFTEFPHLVRLFALTYEDNLASQRVLEKAGFVREAVLRKNAFKDGRYRDQPLYALVR
jgi:[ribosomal protein S5]-alanine N-acetyltransferase